MTREEYEKAKRDLLAERNKIEKQITELSDSFHDDELQSYKNKYNGKYVLTFASESALMPQARTKILTHYFISYIEDVTFVGNWFIRYTGKHWAVDLSDTDKCSITYYRDKDIQLAPEKIDSFIDEKEVKRLLEEARKRCNELVDTV